MSEKLLTKEIAVFVKFHLYDKHAFAPFTGQDFSAWAAFLYACQLYGRSDACGMSNALDAMRACIRACQQNADVLAVFKKSIPGVLDWGFEFQLWDLVRPIRLVDPLEQWALPCSDGPRICSHIHSKPSKKRQGFFKCKDCGAEWRLDEEELRAL